MTEENFSQNETRESKDSQPSKYPAGIIWLLVVVVVISIGIFVILGKLRNSGNNLTNNNFNKDKNANEYSWSQMAEGPYKDKISFALSDDLLDWTDSGKILAEHASVPDVIYKDGVLYVYFVDVSEVDKPEQIGLIKSTDYGLTWTDKQIIKIDGLQNKVAVDPDPFLLPDGRIRLYYFDIAPTRKEGTAGNTIYAATSEDGVKFIEESDPCFQYPDIFDPDVIEVDGKWRMYVGTGSQQVLSAVSDDGLNFTYEGVALDNGAIPNVVVKDGIYYLFTGGIEISTSQNGTTFTKTGRRFDAGKLTADPGVVKLDNGTYFMVYKTKEMKPQEPNF